MKTMLLILCLTLAGCRYAGNMQISLHDCSSVNIDLKDTEQTTEQVAGKDVLRGASAEIPLK